MNKAYLVLRVSLGLLSVQVVETLKWSAYVRKKDRRKALTLVSNSLSTSPPAIPASICLVSDNARDVGLVDLTSFAKPCDTVFPSARCLCSKRCIASNEAAPAIAS